jgi:hypothetical protein
MKDPFTLIGVAATAAVVMLLVLAWFAHKPRSGYPVYGYAGLAILAAGEVLMFHRVEPVATFFTPIAWTGYLLAVDAAVFALRGRSRLRSTPREFATMAFLSVPLWLIFEAYNWHLQNWTYVGMPEPLWQQALGSTWAFATIIPALFETADLLAALGFAAKATARGWRYWLGRHNLMVVIGVLFLALPLFLPTRYAAYLFALVWLGFIFLLEPINLARGHDSLLGDVRKNSGQRLYCLLAAGFICGLLWEFWNFWATARWVYIFPIVQEWKVFEMPVPGYLGFPFFALEMFAMYHFVSGELQRLAERGKAKKKTLSS